MNKTNIKENKLNEKYKLNKTNKTNITRNVVSHNDSPYVLEKQYISNKKLDTHFSCESITNVNTSEELTNVINKILVNESKILFKDFSNNDIVLKQIYEYYYKKIILCNETLDFIQQLLKYQDLLNYKIPLNTVKKLKKEFPNPDPLNILNKKTNKQVNFIVSKYLMGDTDTDWISTLVKLDSHLNYNGTPDYISKMIETSNPSFKYWQFTSELTNQLSSSKINLDKFFDYDKLEDNFITKQSNVSYIDKKDLKKIKKLMTRILNKPIYNNELLDIYQDKWTNCYKIKLDIEEKTNQKGGVSKKKQDEKGKGKKQDEKGKGKKQNKKGKGEDKKKQKKLKKYKYTWTNFENMNKYNSSKYESGYLFLEATIINPFTNNKMKEVLENIHTQIKKKSEPGTRNYATEIKNIPMKLKDDINISWINCITNNFISKENINNKKYKDAYCKFRNNILKNLINFYKKCINVICNILKNIKIQKKDIIKIKSKYNKNTVTSLSKKNINKTATKNKTNNSETKKKTKKSLSEKNTNLRTINKKNKNKKKSKKKLTINNSNKSNITKKKIRKKKLIKKGNKTFNKNNIENLITIN